MYAKPILASALAMVRTCPSRMSALRPLPRLDLLGSCL